MKSGNHIFKSNVLAFCLLCMFSYSFGQGLVVNEVSNGPAGSQEYFELIVVGPTLNPNCGPIDIRGWIVDDNNGDFSCGACAGTGIAAGHYRFGNQAVWANMPTGSMIVLYDPAVKNPKVPADDPTDTSPADGIYILPTSHASLEGSVLPCAAGNIPLPLGACGSCTGNAGYASACYTAGFNGTNAGLRNTGDAAQVRRADGTYFHGIGYGTGGSLINGGPDGLFFLGDGTTRYYALTNASNDNFRNISNFTSGTVASNGESPGLPNSLNNAAWIASLQTPCLLPVTYSQPLAGNAVGRTNLLTWATASELNSAVFEIERSGTSSEGFETIGAISAFGNSNGSIAYHFVDDQPNHQTRYYRLKQIDLNGQFSYSETVEIVNKNAGESTLEIWPNPVDAMLNIRIVGVDEGELYLRDALGRLLWHQFSATDNGAFEAELDVSGFPAGNYFLQLRSNTGFFTKNVLITHL
jgi:hypothetical protein